MGDEDVAADLEVVGLYGTTNGRSCSIHACCGESVKAGNVLRLVACIAETDLGEEESVKCVLVNSDGVDTCTVGFIPRVFVRHGKVTNHMNKFIVVKELYRDSDNTYKRQVSHRNLGAASANFLDEDEGRNE